MPVPIDPIVKEVRDNGARLADECGGDVHRMAKRLRQEQAQHDHRVVRRGRRRITKPDESQESE